MTKYDITPCFSGHDHIRRFQIGFPREFREDYTNHPLEFTTQVHDSLAQDIHIPLIRIQHTLIEFNEHDGNLYAEFTLVDRPEVDGIEFPDSVGPPLAEVVTTLQQTMNYLPVILYSPDYDTPGHVKIMIAYPDSLQEMFEDECTPMKSLSLPRHGAQPVEVIASTKSQISSMEINHVLKERLQEKNNPTVEQNLDEMNKQKQIHQNNEIFPENLRGKKTRYFASASPKELFDNEIMSNSNAWIGEENANPDVVMDLTGEKMDKADDSFYDDPETYGKEEKKTYTPGAMAGMGIGMFFLGALIGILLILASMKKLSLPERIELSTIRRKPK
ncbi:hypothetical protein SK128_004232 [Halocaridina rubra]|uniref:Uncharacterized protein n=1 Tax=Halocaridina rubra TaxID=373956 RepID=A0AAN8X5R3_HALRR